MSNRTLARPSRPSASGSACVAVDECSGRESGREVAHRSHPRIRSIARSSSAWLRKSHSPRRMNAAKKPHRLWVETLLARSAAAKNLRRSPAHRRTSPCRTARSNRAASRSGSSRSAGRMCARPGFAGFLSVLLTTMRPLAGGWCVHPVRSWIIEVGGDISVPRFARKGDKAVPPFLGWRLSLDGHRHVRFNIEPSAKSPLCSPVPTSQPMRRS